MRRTMAIAAMSIALIGLGVATATAGAPKLKGTFSAKERLEATDDPLLKPSGLSDTDRAVFECTDAACLSLTMTLSSPGGTPREVPLTRSGSTYEGTLGPNPADCGPGADATYTAVFKLTAKRNKRGKVRFSGTEKESVQDCEQVSYYDWTLKGKRSR